MKRPNLLEILRVLGDVHTLIFLECKDDRVPMALQDAEVLTRAAVRRIREHVAELEARAPKRAA